MWLRFPFELLRAYDGASLPHFACCVSLVFARIVNWWNLINVLFATVVVYDYSDRKSTDGVPLLPQRKTSFA